MLYLLTGRQIGSGLKVRGNINEVVQEIEEESSRSTSQGSCSWSIQNEDDSRMTESGEAYDSKIREMYCPHCNHLIDDETGVCIVANCECECDAW